MSNTSASTSARDIAVALLGKTYAWHGFIELVLSLPIVGTAEDDRAGRAQSLVMLELRAIDKTINSRKGAGKTAGNMATLARWALLNSFSLYRANGQPVSMAAVEKAKKATESTSTETTESTSTEATESTSTEATESTVRLLAHVAELESINAMMQAAIDAAYHAKNINEARKALVGCISAA